MKNIQQFVGRDDIHTFVMGLWKTNIFKASHEDPNGLVRRLVDKFAYVPRIFAEMSNDTLERAHFSTWWGVIMLRPDYKNPVIHDLYLLHEFYHAAYMPYFGSIGRAAFDEKMTRNELQASVFSEIQIYFEMPELREWSFDHAIYADRFLRDEHMQQLWAGNRAVAIETLRSIRRDVMVSKPEHQLDLTERWVRRFTEQNAASGVVWADRYGEVEHVMEGFQRLSMTHRQDAAIFHREWIENEAAKDTVDFIPFREEAELFSPFYWSTKAKYEAAMKESDV